MKHFNNTLLGAVFLIATSTANYGFDNQGFATTQAMDSFTRKFGVLNAKGVYVLEASWLSLFSGLYFIGFFAGVLIGSSVSARFGRRKTLFGLNAYALLSATVIVTSETRQQILAGRVLNYVYIGMELAAVPVYQAEIVPRQVRGLAVSTYHVALIFGGLIMNLICLGTSKLTDDRAYRIPYGLFYVIPCIVMAGTWLFVPESPRWLLLQDRAEEALVNLRRLREGPFSEEEILKEFEIIKIGLANEQEQGKFWEIFMGKNLLRTFIGGGCKGFENTIGQDLVARFGSLIVKSLGSIDPFIMTVVLALANLVFTTMGMFLADRVGRRPLLLISAGGQAISCMILGAIGTTGWPVASRFQPASLVMLVVLTSFFSIGFAPLSNVVTTEVPALRLRDMTQMFACLMNVLGSMADGLAIPYLLELHLQICWIYGPLGLVALCFVFFFVPDCKGKSMEEIDWLFHNNVPLRQFRDYLVPDLYAEHTSKLGAEDAKSPGEVQTQAVAEE